METNQFEDYETWAANIIEDGEMTPAERENLSKQFEPTQENIKALGIDKETARAYFYIMGKLNDESFVAQTIGEGFSQKDWKIEDIQTRGRALSDFFQAMADVTLAMCSGDIKATLKRVEKRLPFFFKQAGDPSDFKFHSALNELRNIASGKMTF